jgi:hypothetical protein
LHAHCRCIIVPVLQGMRNDPSQTQMNYKDWFDRQDRNTQIDIIGPARYWEYANGKEVTSFAKDGKIMSLEELKIDRTTRLKVFEEIFNESPPVQYMTHKQINDLYNNKLTDEQLQEAFKKRYPHIEVDIVGKMPREQMQILFREYDNLLQKYPVGNRLMSIDVQFMRNAYGEYNSSKSSITFNRKFVNGKVKAIQEDRFKKLIISTNRESHTYIHEFAHAIDRAMSKNGKIGRQLLLQEAYKNIDIKLGKKIETAWITFAKQISNNATLIPKMKVYDDKIKKYVKVPIPEYLWGGEFFAEAFVQWRTSKLPNDMEWLIDFFKNIYL